MQARLETLKIITPFFISDNYDVLKNLGSNYQFEKNDDVKTILYLVYILSLIKLNQKSEAIYKMLSCLKEKNSSFYNYHFKNIISFILKNLDDGSIALAADEAYTMPLIYAEGYSFFNKIPADIHLETNIAMYSMGYNDSDELISLQEIWLKRGLECNDTVAYLLSPIKMYQSVLDRKLNLDQAVQQAYYPAMEMLAFLIVAHHIPKINLNEYFFTNNEPIYINNYEINKYDFKQYELSYALSLLQKIKHINLKLNTAIELINQHFDVAKESYIKTNDAVPLSSINSIEILNKTKSVIPNQFSIEKYFQYIKLFDFSPLEKNIESLKIIISYHNNNFPYHNTELYKAGKLPISERKIPSLDKHSVFNDMVKNHGGYCFQQLELLYVVLSELGFTVDRHVAKTFLQPCSKIQANNVEQIKTHELLLIHLNEKKYIIDSGIANMNLREPIEFKEGEQVIGNDQYRLTKSENNRWRLDTKSFSKNEWFCMYAFFGKAVTYEEINQYHSELYLTKDHRFIRDDLYFSGITTENKRKYISWFFSQPKNGHGIYSSIQNNGDEKKKELGSLEEAVNLSKRKFGIN